MTEWERHERGKEEASHSSERKRIKGGQHSRQMTHVQSSVQESSCNKTQQHRHGGISKSNARRSDTGWCPSTKISRWRQQSLCAHARAKSYGPREAGVSLQVKTCSVCHNSQPSPEPHGPPHKEEETTIRALFPNPPSTPAHSLCPKCFLPPNLPPGLQEPLLKRWL